MISWFIKQNGITFTNNKGTGSNVGDYSDPVRLYKNSEVIVEKEGMMKIVFNCNSGAYATSLYNSILEGSGISKSVDSKIVTVVFSSPVDSFTIDAISAALRIDSLTVTYN